jgi:uncharacterized repeat protein (TIGR01451 family)
MRSVKKETLVLPSSTSLALVTALLLMLLALSAAVGLAQAPPGQVVQTEDTQAANSAAASISVTKTVETETLEPGSYLAYTVVFSNSGDSDLMLHTITDVLPVPFEYVRLTAGTQVLDEPVDKVEPEIVWQGTFTVPATDTLMLRYLVWVPADAEPGPTPYANTVTAAYADKLVGPVSATVTLIRADVRVTKTVLPEEIEAGEPVTYTVVLENKGNAQAVLDLISDTLPPGFVFGSMDSTGTITDAPSGDTGTIVWNGPFTLPATAAITLTYEVTSNASPKDRTATNTVVAVMDGELTEPASATVEFGYVAIMFPMISQDWSPTVFDVTKEAAADEVVKGKTVSYTVVFTNYGSGTGEIDQVTDKLPAGFTFVSMEPGSDVTKAPSVTPGTLVWKGPFQVVGRGTLKLIYKVKVSDQVGVYENEVTATTLVGVPPRVPAKATVEVKEPYLLYEDFESGTDGWEPFLNYWRLFPEQWYLKQGAGYGGSTGMNHTYYLGVTDPRGAERGAHDALYMYQGEGSTEWTDYRIDTWTILRDGEKGEQMGLWVRGKFTQPEDPAIDGKYVQGYYIVWRPRDTSSVTLARLRDSGGTAQHFSDPELLAEADFPMSKNVWYKLSVEVEGSRIRIYVNDQLVIDHEDSTWAKGTVGFFCYKIIDATWDEVLVKPLD